MSGQIVLGQMMIIFAMMLVGLFLCKKEILSPSASKEFSALVVHVCAPMQLIMSVLTNENTSVSKNSLLSFFMISILVYIILIVFGYGINAILRTPQSLRSDYHLMTVFGNCGFIGIPVAQALFGTESLIYVAVFNLCYNIFMYTYGLWRITKDSEQITMKEMIKKFINTGTIASVITVLLFLFQVQVPSQIQNLCTYMGQPATLLALVVIGISLSDMEIKEMLSDVRFFLFTIIRFVIIPIVFVFGMKCFISDALILGTMALMIAVPVGNMPAMMRAQYGQDDHLLAKGAVITTSLSVITITITCMFI